MTQEVTQEVKPRVNQWLNINKIQIQMIIDFDNWSDKGIKFKSKSLEKQLRLDLNKLRRLTLFGLFDDRKNDQKYKELCHQKSRWVDGLSDKSHLLLDLNRITKTYALNQWMNESLEWRLAQKTHWKWKIFKQNTIHKHCYFKQHSIFNPLIFLNKSYDNFNQEYIFSLVLYQGVNQVKLH